MSLPWGGVLSPTAPITLWLPPDDAGRYDPLEDYELGGIGLSDPSQGLKVQTWRVRVVANQILVGAFPYSTEVALYTGTDITEVSLSFDQNMRPTIAFIDSGLAKLYWYDPILGANTVANLDPGITSMFVSMDDKRSEATNGNINDILLVYNRAGLLCNRIQRERYQTEHVLAMLQSPTGRLRKVGMSRSWRMQFQVVY